MVLESGIWGKGLAKTRSLGDYANDEELFSSSGTRLSRVSRLLRHFYLLGALKDSKVAPIPFSYPFARAFFIPLTFLSGLLILAHTFRTKLFLQEQLYHSSCSKRLRTDWKVKRGSSPQDLGSSTSGPFLRLLFLLLLLLLVLWLFSTSSFPLLPRQLYDYSTAKTLFCSRFSSSAANTF